ncbi:MAG: hypothetical protein ACOY2B_12475 [Pseudomonadota bacterium]
MRIAANPLTERIAEIGGQLQRLRWEALDMGYPEMARDIAHAIEAVAWAAGIYAAGANIVARPGSSVQTPPAMQEPAATEQIPITNAA